MQDLIEKTIDHYQLVTLLGVSETGWVYKARDVALQREVAIKILSPQLSHQEGFRDQFLRAARLAAAMDHPGIVKVYDFGQFDERLYIVMEYIPGSNLRELLTGLQATDHWMPLPEAVELGKQVCLAIAHLHNQGGLQREVNPEKIMLKLGPSGSLPYRPVLTDLGLASLLTKQSITQVGASPGKLAYMSPEQVRGDPTDERSDVYSLGVLLFELVTGQVPFSAKTIPEAIRFHNQESLPRLSSLCTGLPASLEATILKALEKDPANRFPSVDRLARALSTLDTAEDAFVGAATMADVGERATLIPLATRGTLNAPITSPEPDKKIKISKIDQVKVSSNEPRGALFSGRLVPQKVQADQIFQVFIENQGNAPETFVVSLESRSLRLSFFPQQAKIAINAGGHGTLNFRAIAQTSFPSFQAQIYPYVARVTSSFGNEQLLTGQVVAKINFPIWALILPMVTCLFLVILSGLLPIGPNRQSWALALLGRTATPTITATLTLSPSHTPSPAPTLSPTLPLTPTLPPTPTITPTQLNTTGTAGKKPWRVLWDLSHGPRQSETGEYYEPDGLYSQLKSILKEKDVLLESNKAPLAEINLDNYALIVIAATSASEKSYTPEEAQIIDEFVRRGGSLLILAEHPNFTNNFQKVIDYYDIDVGRKPISGALTYLNEHPMFKNVSQVNFKFDGGSLNVRNNQAQVVATQKGEAAIVVIDDLPGRVVVVGDANLFDNRGIAQNKQFAISLFRWLT